METGGQYCSFLWVTNEFPLSFACCTVRSCFMRTHRYVKHNTKHNLCKRVVKRFAMFRCARHNYSNTDCVQGRNCRLIQALVSCWLQDPKRRGLSSQIVQNKVIAVIRTTAL